MLQPVASLVAVVFPLLLLQPFSSGFDLHRFHSGRRVSSRNSARIWTTPCSKLHFQPTDDVNNAMDFKVRSCTHAELTACAEIIVQSFYNYTAISPWRQMTKLAELNRLQQGFPYGDDQEMHRMFIAVASSSSVRDGRQETKETICGFVDIDARTPNRPTSYSYNPRPYLSDLCIHPSFRRRGLAKDLVMACEAFTCRLPERFWSHTSGRSDLPELYIRVEAKNKAAISMYDNLGYGAIPNPDGHDIMILYKKLGDNETLIADQRGAMETKVLQA